MADVLLPISPMPVSLLAWKTVEVFAELMSRVVAVAVLSTPMTTGPPSAACATLGRPSAWATKPTAAPMAPPRVGRGVGGIRARSERSRAMVGTLQVWAAGRGRLLLEDEPGHWDRAGGGRREMDGERVGRRVDGNALDRGAPGIAVER